MLYLRLLFVIKDTNEQPDEDGSRRVPVQVSVPVELGCATLLARGCAPQLRSSPNFVGEEFLSRSHYTGTVDEIIGLTGLHLQPLLPPKVQGWD